MKPPLSEEALKLVEQETLALNTSIQEALEKRGYKHSDRNRTLIATKILLSGKFSGDMPLVVDEVVEQLKDRLE